MVVLRGGRFLMSEVPLYLQKYLPAWPSRVLAHMSNVSVMHSHKVKHSDHDSNVQGYLAHKKMHPPRTLP